MRCRHKIGRDPPIEAVSRLAERTQGEMGAVASVAEASSASSQEITANAEQLAGSAEELNRLVSRFRLQR